MRVDLLVLGADGNVTWPLGEIRWLPMMPVHLAPALDGWLESTNADFCLFWDLELGQPDATVVGETIRTPGDAWHGGLRLGTAGLPALIDCVEPVWLLNRDPDPEIVATSWRVSLRACLAKVDVLRQLGGIDPAFETLTGAGLEFGCRLLRRGAIVRHVPSLVRTNAVGEPRASISLGDELRMVRQHFGARWLAWTVWRA